jgi:hypothetical protein
MLKTRDETNINMKTEDFHFHKDLVNSFSSEKSLKRNGTNKRTPPFVGLISITNPRKNPAKRAFLRVK